MEHFFVIYRIDNGPQTVVRRISLEEDRAADDLLAKLDEEGENVRKLCGRNRDVHVVQITQLVRNPKGS